MRPLCRILLLALLVAWTGGSIGCSSGTEEVPRKTDQKPGRIPPQLKEGQDGAKK